MIHCKHEIYCVNYYYFRVKEIDWLPYLTTKLVDDAATHLRLFRQARAKMKIVDKPNSPRGSPLKTDTRLSPKKAHKRNKSETDISWYFGNRNAERQGRNLNCLLVCVKNIFFLESNSTTNMPTLEEIFFDLECKMENNLICRDIVCMDMKKEMGKYIDVYITYFLITVLKLKSNELK